MLTDNVSFEPQTWRRAAGELDSVAGKVITEFDRVLTATADPAACGATGNNMVDSAIMTLIPVYQAVVDSWISSLTKGLSSEGSLLESAGALYEATEDANGQASTQIVNALNM